MYPDTDQPPVALGLNEIYRSATFLKIKDKEYLAAACMEDGCLYLWDIESKISKKVFDPMFPKDKLYKSMNIFKLRENAVGYGEMFASSDGCNRVFILKTDTNPWTLTATLRLFTPNRIYDTCYAEMDGGVPCLSLCVPFNNRVMAVEMISGRSRWEVGKEELGEEFFPWGICTDYNDNVYVADFNQNMIHLLSADDGSVITSITLQHYGIVGSFAVRFHDQCLYVEHHRHSGRRYAVSKFKR